MPQGGAILVPIYIYIYIYTDIHSFKNNSNYNRELCVYVTNAYNSSYIYLALLMLQHLATAMPAKKCEEILIFPKSVDLQKNMRRLRFSCYKKPAIPIFFQSFR